MKNLYLIISALLLMSNSTLAQSYTVTSIPYNPYSYNTWIYMLPNEDDMWTSPIDLPFTFNFFGNSYNKILISSNQIITFDLTNAGLYSPYHIDTAWSIPSTNYPVNTIMGPYQDVDPTWQGSIYYNIIDTFPNKVFVISFYQIPYFGDPNSIVTTMCPDPLYTTSQIVLYENTNIIDIYIQDKETCSGWNNGLAIEGIQDATGTIAYSVPGRNNTVWTTSNDAWRFDPNTVKLSEFNANDFIQISPNPGNGLLTLTLKEFPTKDLEIEIISSLGQLINKDIQNTKTKIIDISNSPKGIYFLKLSSGEKCLFRKIIIK